MGMVVNQYEIFLIDLDPTRGHEIQKTRPCVVISPDEMNHVISTVIIAPMTTKSRPCPTRIGIKFKNKKGWIVLDQIRTIETIRLVKKMGNLDPQYIKRIKAVLKEMLVD